MNDKNNKLDKQVDDLLKEVDTLNRIVRNLQTEIKVQRRTLNIKISELSSRLNSIENKTFRS